MADETIRPVNIAVLIRLMADDTDLTPPDPTTDAIPIETDGISRNSPWTLEQSNEATGSLVSGAPLIVGQPATFGFRSRIKGAGAGKVYTPTVKPPLHAALAACGKRPQFTAAIAAAAATAGTATTLTLANTFPSNAQALVGMPLLISAGAGAGHTPFIVDYTAGRVATLSESFATPLDATTSASLPANWTYGNTSPSDSADRIADQPMALIYFYRDGVLWKYSHCRGMTDLDGRSARPGFGAFSFTGIFQGREDAPVPENLVVANHMAPTLVQGTEGSGVALLKRKPLSLSTWSFAAGTQVSSPDDPNTPQGFGSGEIGGRTPVLTVDPLATLVANRDTISDIGAGVTMPGLLRHGSQAGNRWALTMPMLQPTGESDTQRDPLLGEQITLQALKSGRDFYGRDTDSVLCFY